MGEDVVVDKHARILLEILLGLGDEAVKGPVDAKELLSSPEVGLLDKPGPGASGPCRLSSEYLNVRIRNRQGYAAHKRQGTVGSKLIRLVQSAVGSPAQIRWHCTTGPRRALGQMENLGNGAKRITVSEKMSVREFE